MADEMKKTLAKILELYNTKQIDENCSGYLKMYYFTYYLCVLCVLCYVLHM